MVMNLQDAIAELREQQTKSMERMDVLKHEYQEWQKTVKDLLSKADSMKVPEGGLELDQPVSGDPEVFDIEEFQEFQDRLPKEKSPPTSPTSPWDRSPKGSPSEVRRSKQADGRLQMEQGRLQKLVAEIMVSEEPPEKKDQSWLERQKTTLFQFVDSKWFEYITGCIILLNMVSIGIETDQSIDNGEVFEHTWIERVFLGIYTVEVLLRLLVHGCPLFKNSWFLLDFALVCVGIIALVVAPILGGGKILGVELEQVLVVRGLRLLRLARALRMVGHFKVIWRLVYGILTARHTMLSVSCLVLLWLFIFGCVAVEVITKDATLRSNPETEAVVQDSFGTLPRSILTLLQFVTMDSITTIYYPLVMARPWLLIYFMPILLFFSVALMNLVTAVLVEHALEFAANESEAERLKNKDTIKGALPAMLDFFHQLDSNESGCITKDEIAQVPLSMLPPKLLETLSVDSMTDLFELLDVDGGGTLTQSEFVEGLLNLVLLDVPITTVQSLKLLRSIRTISGQIGEDMKQLKQLHSNAVAWAKAK